MTPEILAPRTPDLVLPKTSLSTYYHASRLRNDAWNRLKRVTRLLHEAVDRGEETRRLRVEAEELFATLTPMEGYWAFPGKRALRNLRRLFDADHFEGLELETSRIVRALTSNAYRAGGRGDQVHDEDEDLHPSDEGQGSGRGRDRRPYFEVLVVDNSGDQDERILREGLQRLRQDRDDFVYDLVVVPSFEDALIAVLLNHNIQSVVIRFGFPIKSENRLELVQRALSSGEYGDLHGAGDADRGMALGEAVHSLRPTLDLFLVTDAPVEEVAGRVGRTFRRVFYRQEDFLELHLSVLKGIHERYQTPFFTALKQYSQKPTGVFHALPISRGKSISKSHWIRDMAQFYGSNVFLAETSATTGGLDSLLQPTGSLRAAQRLAARAFGAKRTFYVTNGTSTANKIVMQSIVRPSDIVLVSRDCHQSHHYSLALCGAQPIYMDPYPIESYSIYGAVPLREIKRHLLKLKAEGKLQRVRMLLLTNCTFDGVSYNVERVMREVLAIHPDILFMWDEAWFAFAYFTPISRRRTANDSANRLRRKLRSPAYRERYAAWRAEHDALDPEDEATWLDRELLPDPDAARVRVYATQSTHKTLTSLRQGSMIHVNDQDFDCKVAQAFHEAYMTHTSTSPNYQILASLDVGRRQVELEGYELVQQSVELAVTLRERVNKHPLLNRYFRILGPRELVPSGYRPSGFETYAEMSTDWARMDQAFEHDEFVLDPTRLTLFIGLTGIAGDDFKKRLIEQHDIQINKTSRNTVLFMTHIGTTRGALAYLIEVLTSMAEEFDVQREDESELDAGLRGDAVHSLTEELPPLPNFSSFHDAFRDDPECETIEGDLRAAFFRSNDESQCEYMKLDGTIERAIESGRQPVSAVYVTPYPPGFPVLVPGQVISREILAFLRATDVKEIHGYEPQYGLRVFTEEALREAASMKGTRQ